MFQTHCVYHTFLNNGQHTVGGPLSSVRHQNTMFFNEKQSTNIDSPNSHPPSDMDQNRASPCAKCQTAIRHPPLQLWRGTRFSPAPLCDLLDRLGAPPFALCTCTFFEEIHVQSVGQLHLTPLRSGNLVQKQPCPLCELQDAPGQPPFAECEILLDLRTLLCNSLDRICLPSFGPYPPSLICRDRVTWSGS